MARWRYLGLNKTQILQMRNHFKNNNFWRFRILWNTATSDWSRPRGLKENCRFFRQQEERKISLSHVCSANNSLFKKLPPFQIQLSAFPLAPTKGINTNVMFVTFSQSRSINLPNLKLIQRATSSIMQLLFPSSAIFCFGEQREGKELNLYGAFKLTIYFFLTTNITGLLK